MTADRFSYREIVRSSSVIGGAAALNYIVGLIRVKLVAILLGPTGIGLLGLYGSYMALIGTVSGLGIAGSAVREIAQTANGDPEGMARAARILERVSWAIGLLGWLLALVFARPLSIWLFGSADQTVPVSLLGAALLINALANGQQALLQGTRRIGDIARMNVASVFISTVVSLALFATLGNGGILPSLISAALINWLVSSWFARRVDLAPISVSWRDTLSGAGNFLTLGFAFMWSGVMAAALDAFARSVVTSNFGVQAAGVYQAAWSLSGLFAGFILSAMGTDFYPRLTAVIHDRARTIRLVNEQTEVGILTALPGLLATLAFAPLVMKVFYTSEFVAGAELLRWMVLGVFGRVLSWPMGFILLAKGAARWTWIVETVFAVAQAALVILFQQVFGLVGVAQAFAAAYAVHVVVMLWVAWRFIGYSWSPTVTRLAVISAGLIVAAFASSWLLADSRAIVAGFLLSSIGCMVSAQGLAHRLDFMGSSTKKWRGAGGR
jgi:antigen flippase